MLLTILIAIAAALVLVAALWFGLGFAMRRPALARRMMRVPPLRWLMARVTAFGMRQMRRKALRDGRIKPGQPVSDLELALMASDTEESRRAQAMLARMSPRQRAEVSRRTMGPDGLGGLRGDGPGIGDGEGAGRAARRQAAGVPASAGNSTRSAHQRKAVARRRAARKSGRR